MNLYAILLGKKLAGEGGGGGDITVESITITENGTTTAPSGKAYSPVTVNVPQVTVEALSVTENGTTTAPSGKAYSPVTVNVPQVTVEALSVTENGTTTAPSGKAYSPVTVNVPQVTVEPITITENGTTTAPSGKAYSPITVNVSASAGPLKQIIERSVQTITADDLSGVTKIGMRAFAYCQSLNSVVLPASVQALDQDAFQYCALLTSVNVGNGVTSIGSGAFYNCSYLSTVVLGSALTSVGGNAFARNPSANVSITVLAISPPSIFSNTFVSASGLSDSWRVYVPAASLEAYKTAEYWSNYASHIYAITT